MPVRRARRYPQPPPAHQVLDGVRCTHGELPGRCALCRLAGKPPDDHDAPKPADEQPARAPVVGDDGDDPRAVTRRQP